LSFCGSLFRGTPQSNRTFFVLETPTRRVPPLSVSVPFVLYSLRFPFFFFFGAGSCAGHLFAIGLLATPVFRPFFFHVKLCVFFFIHLPFLSCLNILPVSSWAYLWPKDFFISNGLVFLRFFWSFPFFLPFLAIVLQGKNVYFFPFLPHAFLACPFLTGLLNLAPDLRPRTSPGHVSPTQFRSFLCSWEVWFSVAEPHASYLPHDRSSSFRTSSSFFHFTSSPPYLAQSSWSTTKTVFCQPLHALIWVLFPPLSPSGPTFRFSFGTFLEGSCMVWV